MAQTDRAPEEPGPAFEPQMVLLCCQAALAGPLDTEGMDPALRVILLPCSSKVEIAQLLRLLEAGADGVVVVACHQRRSCRFMVGPSRAAKRVEWVRRHLEAIGMGADRIGLERGDGLGKEEILSLAKAHGEALMPLGKNPMRGER